MPAATHNKFSPSSAHLWWNCALSLLMVEKFPKETSEHATRGTVLHGLVTRIIKRWWEDPTRDLISPEDPYNYVGEKFEEDDRIYTITDNDAEAMQFCIGETINIVDTDGRSGKLTLDIRADLSVHNQGCGGTLDVLYVSEKNKKVHIADYKFGQGHVVAVDGNRQLLSYAAAVLNDMRGVRYCYSLHIIQPSAFHPDGRSRSCEYGHDVIRDYLFELAKRVKFCVENPTDMVAGSWCNEFCAGKGKCQGQYDMVKVEAEKCFSLVVKELDPIQVADLLDKEDTIIEFFKSLRKYAVELVTVSGKQIPRYKLIEKTGHRKWVSEEDAIRELSVLHGDDIYQEPKLKTPAQAEKLFGKGKKGKEEFERICGNLVEVPRNGFELVPSDSSKPEVAEIAANHFNDVSSIAVSAFTELGL